MNMTLFPMLSNLMINGLKLNLNAIYLKLRCVIIFQKKKYLDMIKLGYNKSILPMMKFELCNEMYTLP